MTPRQTHATLAQALHGARDELAREQPPPELLQRLLDAPGPALQTTAPSATQTAAPAARVRVARWAGLAPWLWSAGLACTAVLVGSVVLMLQAPVPELQPRDAFDARGLRMSGFVPLAGAERWPADAAPAWLVSTELRQDRLALLGLPYDPSRAGDSVRAELLVRASGEVLAVRLAP
jgi:hypothetical protein